MKQMIVGVKLSLLGRFNGNVGQVVSAVCGAFGLDLRFADFKACKDNSLTGGKIPDVVCMTSQGELRIIGEVKTPWIKEHGLEEAYRRGRVKLDRIFGQIALKCS
ncbi:hypothetical protein BBP40_000950 [Aspergillus hancockii]|nr:hypothetical protein BBP40_000950 [Aspergillus hancockii]